MGCLKTISPKALIPEKTIPEITKLFLSFNLSEKIPMGILKITWASPYELNIIPIKPVLIFNSFKYGEKIEGYV